jgi:hypothetical protein
MESSRGREAPGMDQGYALQYLRLRDQLYSEGLGDREERVEFVT